MATGKIMLRLKVPTKNVNEKADSRIALISPILGPRAIKPIDFLKIFDSKTSKYKSVVNLIVHVTVIIDVRGKAKSFTLSIGTLSVADIIKQILKLDKLPSQERMSKQTISNSQIDMAVQQKQECFTHVSDSSVRNMIIGSLKSMHIKIKD